MSSFFFRDIVHLISATQGNLTRAAALLDVDRHSLYRMIDRYRIELPRRAGQGG